MSEIAGSPRAVTLQTATAGSVPELANIYDSSHQIDVAHLGSDALAKLDQIVATVPKLDSAAVNAFGVEPQTRANQFLDQLLEGIQTGDAGPSGALLAELATGVKAINITGLQREAANGQSIMANFLQRLPWLGKYVSAFQAFKANYRKIIDHFSDIEKRGQSEMAKLTAMDSKMDRLVAENLSNLRELEVHLAAGQRILTRERERFAARRTAAITNNDPVELAAVRDFGEQINGFETRLLRLHMALTDAMQSIPQTRTAQTAGRIEYRNIMDTLLFDLPRLKAAIVRIAALKQISDASKSSDARRKLANSMAQAGVQALDDAYTKAKQSEGGALAEIAMMGDIADRIIGIVDKGAQIDVKNREERIKAQQALTQIKQKFAEGFIKSTANAVASSR
ncbi:toxic anion resistance protein [Methylovirgula sp. 4M-Z18]|uniref:toxic anion resistance protein n=1 Tax=Methylovirgula sp. 4M-Z18 TaxID=2293567 RepID=UPI0013142902|nr:toxic anion resistance protein [Methylovirgula sp. 4M-Z18]